MVHLLRHTNCRLAKFEKLPGIDEGLDDVLLSDHIDVSFVNVTGMVRHPAAHICSCLLDIPKTYESLPGIFGCPECVSVKDII